MIISSAIAFTIGFIGGLAGVTAFSAAAIGIISAISMIGAAFIYGGVAMSLSAKKMGGLSNSPTYGQSLKQTQTDPNLREPLSASVTLSEATAPVKLPT